MDGLYLVCLWWLIIHENVIALMSWLSCYPWILVSSVLESVRVDCRDRFVYSSCQSCRIAKPLHSLFPFLFFFWKLIDEEKGACIVQFLFYFFAYQSRVGVDWHISKKPSQQWSKKQCNHAINHSHICTISFEVWKRIRFFKLIDVTKWLRFSEMCSVLTIIPDKKNTIPSKNKPRLSSFVSPICCRGFFGRGTFFENLHKVSKNNVASDPSSVIRFMMIRNTGIVY